MSEISNHISSAQKPLKRRRPIVNAGLFLATLASTWLAGAMGETYDEAISNGLIYMGAVMAILLSHEMGHYIMARRNQVDASLPYFIPFPLSLFGTLGAVIVMRGRIRSRDALMEVGAAGPLAGMIVAIPILMIGLHLSPITPISEAGMMEGKSILYVFLKWLVVGHIPEGEDVLLHPMAWAGWIGFLVTMLNLLPIGQLDGGHIFYALFDKAHGRVSRLFLLGIFLLGLGVMATSAMDAYSRDLSGEAFWAQVFTGLNWVVLGSLMLLVFGRKKGRGFDHPPTDDNTLSPRHRIVGIICIILFVVTFMPVPLRVIT